MENLDDVINLWVYQIYQHAVILEELSSVTIIKTTMNKEQMIWKKWIGNPPSIELLKKGIKKFINTKASMLKKINDGYVLGNIYPSLLKHMIKEELFFLKKISNNISKAEEVRFWIEENAEHTKLAAHLLDPSEDSKVYQSLNIGDSLLESINRESPSSALTLYKKSNNAAKKLSRELDANMVSTLNLSMTSYMIKHEIREATYGEHRLQQLLS